MNALNMIPTMNFTEADQAAMAADEADENTVLTFV